MAFRFAAVLDSFHYFQNDGVDTGLNGGNLGITGGFRVFAQRPEVEAMEIYVDPSVLANPAKLKEAADLVLPSWRRGQGFLSFLDVHSIPEVWADKRERILWSVDVRRSSRERLLRDLYAQGPTPICWDSHSLGSFYFYWDLLAAAHFQPVGYDRVAALSHALAVGLDRMFAHIRPDLPGFLCPSEVIFYRVDTDKFTPPDLDRKKFIRQTLKLPQDKVIALFLGRLTPHCKADLFPMLEAFAEARQPDSHLLIVGPENTVNYAAALQEKARMLGIEDAVTIRGPVEPDLRHLVFAACDLFLFPGDSTIEALGMTGIEAMATGLPVLASDWDGIREYVEDGVTGWKIPCTWVPALERIEAFASVTNCITDFLFQAQTIIIDMDLFASRLKDLLSDPELRERMGRAARAKAETDYGKEKSLGRLFGMWERQLDQARQEDEETREARRQHAKASPLGYPGTSFLSHYATRTAKVSDGVELTDKGRRVRQGREKLSFYDDTLSMVSGPAMELALWQADQGGASYGSLVQTIVSKLGGDPSTAGLQIAFLLKQGALRLRVK
jgi:glycosyltransferase involved in cell wall biosynthesis